MNLHEGECGISQLKNSIHLRCIFIKYLKYSVFNSQEKMCFRAQDWLYILTVFDPGLTEFVFTKFCIF